MMGASTTPNGDSIMSKCTFWTDKRCFITGAASGIGQAVAIAAARRGARLLLTEDAGAALFASWMTHQLHVHAFAARGSAAAGNSHSSGQRFNGALASGAP